MALAHWFTQHEEGGLPVERAALGSCDLSLLHVGGEWQWWLVRQAGRDVALAPLASWCVSSLLCTPGDISILRQHEGGA
jgi:hypothetical protein